MPDIQEAKCFEFTVQIPPPPIELLRNTLLEIEDYNWKIIPGRLFGEDSEAMGTRTEMRFGSCSGEAAFSPSLQTISYLPLSVAPSSILHYLCNFIIILLLQRGG